MQKQLALCLSALLSIAVAPALVSADAGPAGPADGPAALALGERLLAASPTEAWRETLALRDATPVETAPSLPLEEALAAAFTARGEEAPVEALAHLRALPPEWQEGLAAALTAAALAHELALAGKHDAAATVLLQGAADLAPVAKTVVPPFSYGTVLRVAGTGPDTFTQSFLVHVDQGGDDTYVGSSSAGASALTGFPAMLALDLDGDDTYVATNAPLVVAQGAGYLGAGVLVDLAGNDEYQASSVANAECKSNGVQAATTVAQGGGYLGAGILVDLAGVDTYAADAWSCGSTAIVAAQGGGYTAGVGLLVDGPDALLDCGREGCLRESYSAHAVSTLVQTGPSSWAVGYGIVAAQGGGLVGAGVLVNPGNGLGATGLSPYSDANVMHASAHGGGGTVAAQGGGITGAGVLADGEGDDVRDARAVGAISISNSLSGHYSFVSVGTSATAGHTQVAAQGGSFLGVGVLVDLLGDDRNSADAWTYADASSTAHSSYSGGTVVTSATASNGGASVAAQGGAEGGVAFHVDVVGNDVYGAGATAETYAYARSTGGSSRSATATAFCGASFVNAQGAAFLGAGGLVDVLGTDQYDTGAHYACSATRNTGGSNMPGTTHHQSADVTQHGEGEIGLGAFVDLDGTDTQGSTHASSYQSPGCWSNTPPTLQPHFGYGLNWDSPTSPYCIPPPF